MFSNIDEIKISDLGTRICIIGPSNSGKSTLATKLSAALNIPCYHLDQIAFLECTNWQRKSDEALIMEHNQIISQDHWIIDGNYSICMPDRLARATSVIWLDMNLFGALTRYILRSIKNDPGRPGRLKSATREFNWPLISYTLFQYPKNKKRYQEFLRDFAPKKVVYITSMKQLNQLSQKWGI